MKKVILILSIISQSLSWGGHKEGNGGDHLRATFIKVGENVISFLLETKEGNDILFTNSLNIEKLKTTLDINVIKVTDDLLRDNGGSVVDALGMKDQIFLNKMAWLEHFEQNRDVAYLVFHEMLRASEVNDDNYIISKMIHPLPIDYRLHTKIAPTLALIKSDSLKDTIDISSIEMNGSGCSIKDGNHYFEFDEEENTMTMALKKMSVDSLDGGSLGRKACSLTIPFKSLSSEVLVISALDISGIVNLY